MTKDFLFEKELFKRFNKMLEKKLTKEEVEIDGLTIFARGDKISFQYGKDCEILLLNDEPFLINEDYKIEEEVEEEINL